MRRSKKVGVLTVDAMMSDAVNCLGSIDKVMKAIGYSGYSVWDTWIRQGEVPEVAKWALIGLNGKCSGNGLEQKEIIDMIQLAAEANKKELVIKLASMI